MLQADAEALVARYVGFLAGAADAGFVELLGEDFLDHVSGQRGPDIWAKVAGWLSSTLADPEVAVHEVMTRGDRVMVWLTVTATHIGAGLPRLRDIPVTGRRVDWTQFHVFRVSDGSITEHWAVRDDYGLVESLVGGGPLVAPS